MDVTKLFETPHDKLEPLAADRLEAMIDAALSHPQSHPAVRNPANENLPFIKRALAIAAALVLVITVSVNLLPTAGHNAGTASASDAYDEISDLLIYETLSDHG